MCRGLPVTYTVVGPLLPCAVLATEKVRLIKRLLSFVPEYFAVVKL